MATDRADDLVDIDPEFDSDGERCDQLVATVGSILGKSENNRTSTRNEPSQKIGELGLPSDAQSKVAIHQLLNNIVDTNGKIKKQIRKITHKKLVGLPIDTLTGKKIQRQVFYDDAKKEVTKWEPVVEQNRAKPQIIFPLERPDERCETVQDKFNLKKTNPLKREIDELLSTSTNVIKENTVLTAEEEKFLNSMSVEEARLRHAKLQKMRALLSYQEVKLKRKAKIKSKKYRKLLKREKLKEELKQFEELKSKDPNAALEKLEQADKLRALERASLKHQSTGKWAKHNILRSKYDEKTREDLKEQMQENRKLSRKVTFDLEDEEDDDEEEEEADNIKKGEVMMQSGLHEEEEKNPWLLRDPSNNEPNPIGEDAKITDPNVTFKINTDMPDFQQLGPDVESDDEDGDGDDDERKKLMVEAFDEDDVIAEFKQDKKDAIEKEGGKDIVTYLPGWGSWAGPGINENKRLKRKFTQKAQNKKRKDANLPNVIISEEKNKTISKFMVKELPYDCRNVSTFEKKLKRPIGPNWNPETQYRFNIEPKVITKMGKIIDPINEKALVKKPESKRRPLDQVTKSLTDLIPI